MELNEILKLAQGHIVNKYKSKSLTGLRCLPICYSTQEIKCTGSPHFAW